jgi:hypothetical protein
MKGLHASVGIANSELFRGSDSENTPVVLADIPDFRNALDWAKAGGEETFNASQVSLKAYTKPPASCPQYEECPIFVQVFG